MTVTIATALPTHNKLRDLFFPLQNIEDLVVDLKSLVTAAKAYHAAVQSKYESEKDTCFLFCFE